MPLKITLRQWYCWGDQTLDLAAPCSSVVGANGSGKTSGVRDALEFALIGTGFLRGAKTKRELAAVAIRDDAEECEVIVEAKEIRVRRTMDREGKQEVWRSVWAHHVDGKAGGWGWSNEEPMALKRDQGNPLGDPDVPDDLVRCMLEPTYFATLDSSRRQEILVMATSDRKVEEAVARDALIHGLEATDPDIVTVDLGRPDGADIADKMLDAIADAARWIAESGFRGAEDAAIERRREAKRDRQQVVVGEQPEAMVRIGEGEGVEIDLAIKPLEVHQARLASLRQEHLGVVQLESAGAGAMQGKLTEAEQAFAELEAQPMPEREKLTAGEAPSPFEEPDYEALGEARNKAQAVRDEARQDMRATSEEIEALEAKLAGSREFSRPDECPKGPAGMRCPVKPSVWKPAVERALGDRQLQEAKLDDLRGQLVEKKKANEEAHAAHQEADRQCRVQAQAHQARKDLVAAEERRVESDRKAEERYQAALQKRSEAVLAGSIRVEKAREAFEAAQQGEKPSGPSAAELAEKIKLGEAVCEASRDYWLAREAWGRREVQASELDVHIVRWDAIAQQLKPEGIETTLGGNAREAFMGLLATGSQLSGPIHLDEDCGITVEVDREDRPRHPLQLSTSQQLAVGIVIQHALCQMLSFPILVMDAVDTFDSAKRKEWVAFSSFVASSYPGGVVGLATIVKDPSAPAPPWRTLWIKPDRSVTELGTPEF